MNLAQILDDPEARATRAILVADINGSTQMKESTPEIQWIPTFFRFYDLVRSVVAEEGGTVSKYLGDGVMAVFGEDFAGPAINAAIKIQERVENENAANRLRFTCSIGVAYGEVVVFPATGEVVDHLGAVVDRAFRLSSAANAKAIFVDTEVVSAAAMNRVHSDVGQALRRKVADYQGPVERVQLKGFSQPVTYHEIWWAADRYGVSAGFVTSEAATSAPSQPFGRLQTEGVARAKPASEWLHGRVKRWGHNMDFGFITDDREDFYFNREYLFSAEFDVQEQGRVLFQALDALEAGKSRRADRIFVIGERLAGTLTNVNSRGFGFADVNGRRGEQHSLFVLLGPASPFRIGDIIECDIGENHQGPIGTNPRLKPVTSPA